MSESRPNVSAPQPPAPQAAPALPSFVAPHARLATPDLARGGMLLLIALANVSIWFYTPWLGFSGDPEAHRGLASQVFELLRTGFVDHRSYPLFALLFGFGLATMAPPPSSTKRSDPQAQWNRKLLRRRGWWMLLFGFVHCLLFMGDIIGPYGLTAVVMAGLIAHRRRKTMIAIAVIISILTVVAVLGMDISDTPEPGVASSAGAVWWIQWPLMNILTWVMELVLGTLATFMVPAAICGVFLADSGILRDPQRRLGLARTVAVGGLGLGFLASLPHGLDVAGFVSHEISGAGALNEAASPLSALGWVAVFSLLAIATERAARPSMVAHVLTAVGRRSMTAYLGQSVLFALAFTALAAAGMLGSLTPLLTGVLAVAVWAIMAAVCVWMDARGLAGPFERLLRWLVRRTARTPRPDHLAGVDSPAAVSPAGPSSLPATPGR